MAFFILYCAVPVDISEMGSELAAEIPMAPASIYTLFRDGKGSGCKNQCGAGYY